MICVIFMICILLLSVTFVMYFNGRNEDKTTIAIRFNLLRVCPSLPLLVLFYSVIYTFFLSCFDRLILSFTQFVGVPMHCLNFENFRETAALLPLIPNFHGQAMVVLTGSTVN